jgi:hypothetical protein
MVKINQRYKPLPVIYAAFLLLSLAAIEMGFTCGLSAQQTPATQDEVQSENKPPPTASLLETSPSQPQVTCNGSQLTIKANNATLGSILTAVGACIGTKIDVPEGAARERMFVEFGPGPTGETLTSLLGSTDFDFVVSASQSNPQKIDTVLVLLRSENSPAPADAAPTRSRRAWLENRRNENAMRAGKEDAVQAVPDPAESPAATAEATASAENAAASADPDPTNATESPVAETSSAPTTNVAPSSTLPAASAVPGNGTQDMISNMRQLFEQRRQMVESQKSTPQ